MIASATIAPPSITGEGPRGKLTTNAPLAPIVWFKSGGSAETLFEPADVDDLQTFVRDLDPTTPVWPLGLGSNLIVRDGGIRGVTVRLGKPFAKVEVLDANMVRCGGGASGNLVSSTARDAGIAGLEFLRGIPGTVGGFVRMNGGAYGREVADVLVECDVVLRSGALVTLVASDLRYTYRHSELPDQAIVVSATLRGTPGDPKAIGAEMDRIAAAREASQPLRSKTGGSTFKNPDGQKAWALIDAAGCRGLAIGGAQVSEKHTNFLINTGTATSADIEALGEEVRARVLAHSGVVLEWEIQRVGDAGPSGVHAKPRSREGSVRVEGTAPDVEEVARVAVDCAFKIHRDLGPGLLESVYEAVLAGALSRAGLRVARQVPINISYDGLEFAEGFRADLIVEDSLIIEIKSVDSLAKVHGKQLLTYLRLARQPIGLLINFGAPTFKEGIRRVVNEHTDFATSRLRVNQPSSSGPRI